MRHLRNSICARRMLLVSLWPLIAGCGPTDRLEQARVASDNGDVALVEQIVKAIPSQDPQWLEAQLVLADAATIHRGPEHGLTYYEVIPRDGSRTALKAARAVAELNYQHGSIEKAIEGFEYLVTQLPEDFRLRSRLARLLLLCGLRSRAEDHLFAVAKTGRIEVSDMVTLSEPDRPTRVSQFLRQRVATHPDDPHINLGLAVEEFGNQQFEEARKRLSQLVQSHPNFAEAQALLGEVQLDGAFSDLEAWSAKLPEAVQQHSGIWYVRGLWAKRLNQPQVAARCFWETVRQSPTHRRAMYQLGQVLSPLDATAGKVFADRAAQLKSYSEMMEQVLIRQGKDHDLFRQMITSLTEMGREWEAWAWASLARDLVNSSKWPDELMKRLAHVQTTSAPRFQADRDVSRLHDLSHYPDFTTLAPKDAARGPQPATVASRIAFVDRAAELGIEFTYFQSPDARTRGVRIFESTGGGVGVLDFDLDTWPDLFFTQGEEWPVGKNQPQPSAAYRDRLYRNVGGGFQDVTDAAGLGVEEGYGQGCSCGDYNNDGFPDIYVANIGRNQLLLNCGDGTYTDATQMAGITGEAWTTSCLILDLNADGQPDLYDVNYLQGEQIYSVECRANRCSVRGYEGTPDQVQLSRGDGTFFTVPDGTPQFQGKGLGIVALFANSEPRPSLFIANDQVPNFFLRPTNDDGRYTDEALLCGLAVNRDGHPTACMGVAAGDLNHDRHIDLFVTNFEGEANTLYLQRERAFFQDAIVGSGLMSAGIPYVGWGTQFLDAENDGELDVVVANGHVADFGEPGIEYRMPTQFFRNDGQGQFRQLTSGEVGIFFERKLFGRALATLDWNRDGRTDFVLSNIESPAALVTNQTESPGHWLDVRLHARLTARDAVGTLVEVHQGATVRWQQLIAGDGYQATNERKLHFGLGTTDTIDRCVVHWLSGAKSTFASLPVDKTLVVIEGRDQPIY